MDTFQLVQAQKAIYNELVNINSEYDKNVASRTGASIKRFLLKMTELWHTFEKNHAEIVKVTKPDTPYIVTDVYGKTKSYYEDSFIKIQTHSFSTTTEDGASNQETDPNMRDVTNPGREQSTAGTATNATSSIASTVSTQATTMGLATTTVTTMTDTIASTASGLSNVRDTLRDDSTSSESSPQELRIRKQKIKLKGLHIAISQLSTLTECTITPELFESKRLLIMSQWSSITELHEDILLHSTNDQEEYITANVYEDAYNCMANALDNLSKRTSRYTNGSSTNTDNKLPRLKIPVFKGEYLKWTSFSDIFKTLIHNKTSLSSIEKFEYLKTYVEGEPLRLISSYALSGDNYSAAWKALESRYNNKRQLVTKHMDNMHRPIGKIATAQSIRTLYDGINESLAALSNMGYDVTTWDPIIIYHNIKLLDEESRNLFEQFHVINPNEMPSLDVYLKFLDQRFKTLELRDGAKDKTGGITKPSVKANYATKTTNGTNSSVSCINCKRNHKIYFCPQFTDWTPEQRKTFIKRQNCCLNCLSQHKSRTCPSKFKCKVCNEQHHSLLHPTESSTNDVLGCFGITSNNLVAATAIVQIKDNFGIKHNARVFIDTGSHVNFITETCVDKLNLRRSNINPISVRGIGGKRAFTVTNSTKFEISPHFKSNFTMEITALINNKLTTTVPETTVTTKLPWNNLQLADDKFNIPSEIDIILGLEAIPVILLPEVRKTAKFNLIAVKSELGWLILGSTNNQHCSATSVTSMVSNVDLAKYWELEEISSKPILSPDEERCENIFRQSCKRNSDGRYVVDIPFKTSFSQVSNLAVSRNVALVRLYQMNKKFKSNPEFCKQYTEFIKEYIRLGHMKEIEEDFDPNAYYLPHHAVVKPDSATTKLRVVFDASAKSIISPSLNSQMLSGPRLQDDLSTIILRWRRHKYVFTSDVEKMFRQILVSPRHRKYQRILWNNSEDKKVRTFELSTVTYGTTSAPYLAVKTMQRLADDEGNNYPHASVVTKTDFYVDDILTGADTIAQCVILQSELSSMFKTAGFQLRKWSANDLQILKNIDKDDISNQHFMICDDSSIKTLGIRWTPKTDCFTFKVSTMDFSKTVLTKTTLSSDIARLFDPLGWLSPITILAKLLLQECWTRNLNWTDILPDDIIAEWKNFRTYLAHIDNIKIPRWIHTSVGVQLQLHGFSDASEKAYSAVIYALVIFPDSSAKSSLLIAKTKVAPLKQKATVAKLELCGALLLAKLYQYVIKTFSWESKEFFAWCDSKITLAWIQSDPSRWKVFVAHRISEIQNLTKRESWNYVPSSQNPADCATRGLSGDKLLNLNLWWYGPTWMQQSKEHWPCFLGELIPDTTELKKSSMSLIVKSTEDEFIIEDIVKRFSDYDKLVRVISYCFRFVNACRGKSIQGYLRLSEKLDTESKIISNIQMNRYQGPFKELKSLAPFIDNASVLRVGGRLKNSFLTYDERHPIIIPYHTHLATLIVRDAHERSFHGHINLTEAIVRKRFWIIKGHRLISTYINRCVTCKIHSPSRSQQFMGDLPTSRVITNHAFYHTGVDYAGPLEVKAWKGRCNKKYKSYIVLFVCMTTRAIHIETSSDLSASGFIAAFKRFASRRGPCFHVYSDCGTNFVGANNVFKINYKAFQNQWAKAISQNQSTRQLTWHFNPPGAAHMGGIWEAGIKSAKTLMYRILNTSLLTFEELSTLLIQVEGLLNSRPLYRITSSTEDQEYLTPSHFLTGTTMFTPPEPELTKVTASERWKHIQQLKQHFWQLWSQRYLQSLQPRKKWTKVTENIRVNDLVLVENPDTPPFKWPKAIVTEVKPGKDNIVRVVTVRLSNGAFLTRPITKVSVIPLSEEPLTQPNANDNTKPIQHNVDSKSKATGSKKEAKQPNKYMNGFFSMLFIVLIFFPLVIASNIDPIKTTTFEHNSGMFFPQVGKLKLGIHNWKIITYYNTSSYFNEFQFLKETAHKIQATCKQREDFTTYCSAVGHEFEITLHELSSINDMILDLNHEVPFHVLNKRSPFNFIGNWASRSFGILAEEHAAYIAKEINVSRQNENHLLNLIKNQTSVVESTLNSFKLAEDRFANKFQLVSSYLDDFAKQSNSILDAVNKNELMLKVEFIVEYLILRIERYSKIQSSILQAVMDAHHGKLYNILNPADFRHQLQVMKSTLPKNINIPTSSDDLLTLYSLLSTHTRVSSELIIFQLELPLVSADEYELFKVVPLPSRSGSTVVMLRPTTELLAVSVFRDKYIELSSEELKQCNELSKSTVICMERHPVNKNIKDHNSCEMSLFTTTKTSYSLCKTITIESKEIWIQLPSANDWVYSLEEPHSFNVICGNNVLQKGISGDGILTLNGNCTLDHDLLTIHGRNEFENNVHRKFFFPDVNISMFNVELSSQEKLVVNKSLFLVRKTDFSQIEDELGIIKRGSTLPEQHVKTMAVYKPLTITGLSLSSLITVVVIVYGTIKSVRRCKARITPTPKPRLRTQEGPRIEDFEA